MTPNQRKAEQAKRLLEDEMLNDAICAMRKACYDQIEGTALDEKEKREDLFFMLKAVIMFENELRHFINKGKLDNLNVMPQINKVQR